MKHGLSLLILYLLLTALLFSCTTTNEAFRDKPIDEQVQLFMSKPDSNIKKLITLADDAVAQKFVKACLLLGITDSAKMYRLGFV